MKLEQSDSGKNSPNSCQDRDSNDGNIHPMKSLPCPCGQRFIESQDFVEHARTCSLFAMTASSFAEAARAVTSVNTNKSDIDIEGQFNHKRAMSNEQLSNNHDVEEKEIPHPFTIGRGALDLTNRSISMMENEPSFGISNVGLNETQYTCLQCNATYASQSTLMKHFDKDHNVRGSFTCDCNSTFDNLSTLLSHQMSCLTKSETKMKTNNLSCSMCGQSGFQFPAELLGHMNSCHMLGNNNNAMFSLPSSFSGNFDSKIPHPSVLRRGASFLQSGSSILPHLIPNLMNNSGNTLNSPVNNILSKPSKPVTPEIRQGNNRNSKMNENRDNSTGSSDLSRPFRCDHCVKSFKSKALLDQHMHIHFPPKYTCRYCSKKYRWPPVFYHHQRTCKKRSQPAITTASASIISENNRILNTKSNMPPHSNYEFGSSRQSGLDQHSMMCNDLKFGRGNKPPYLSYLNGNSFPPNTCNMNANGKQRPINSTSVCSPTISNPTNASNHTSSGPSDLSMFGNKAPNFMAMMAAASMGMRFPWVPPLGLNNMNGSTNSVTSNSESIQRSTPFNPSSNSSTFNWKTNLPYRQSENGSNPNISSLTKCLCGSKFDDFTSYFTHISTCKHFAKSTNTSNSFASPFNYIQNLLESKIQEKGNKIDVDNENDKQTLSTTASALASMVASMNSTFSKQEFNISNMFTCMQNSMSNIGSKRPYSPVHNNDEDETNSSASPKIRMDSKNISSNLLSEMANVLVSATNCENKRLSCDSVNQNMTSSSSSCGEPSSKSPDATLNQLHDRKSMGDNSDNLDTTGSHPSSPASETVCKICCKEFSNRLALKQHFDGKHGSEYRYKCPGCGKSYRWGASYYYHRKSCQAVKELGINGDEEDINTSNYEYISKVPSHIGDGLRSYDEQNMDLMYKGHILSPSDMNKSGNVDNIESSSDPEIDRSPIPYDDKDDDDVDESIPRQEKIPRSNSALAHGSRSRSVLCSPTNPISALGDMLVE